MSFGILDLGDVVDVSFGIEPEFDELGDGTLVISNIIKKLKVFPASLCIL